MRTRSGSWLLLWVLAFGSSPHAVQAQHSSPAAVEPKTALSIGVAPFESVEDPSAALPEVATLLARRLSTRGVEHVVGPDALGATPLAEPPAEDVVRWASAARVDALVVGRATRLGRSYSFDADVRSGASGASLGAPLVAEATGADDLARAVDLLAEGVLSRVAALPAQPARASVVATRPPGAARPRSSLASLRSDAPISIHSDELEVLQQQGGRRFVFKGHVRAEQQDMVLRSDRLEARYPEGGSQPDQLVATGHVEMTQAGRRAICDRAVFHRNEQRLVCTGNAQLEERCDRVRGEEIVFHVNSEVLEVKGSADVRIHPKDAPCNAEERAS